MDAITFHFLIILIVFKELDMCLMDVITTYNDIYMKMI